MPGAISPLPRTTIRFIFARFYSTEAGAVNEPVDEGRGGAPERGSAGERLLTLRDELDPLIDRQRDVTAAAEKVVRRGVQFGCAR